MGEFLFFLVGRPVRHTLRSGLSDGSMGHQAVESFRVGLREEGPVEVEERGARRLSTIRCRLKP